MTNVRPYLQDTWAELAHVPAMGDGALGARPPGMDPRAGWVDDVDARRLTAYRILEAYRSNTRRFWLPERMWTAAASASPDAEGAFRWVGESAASKYREYGHGALLADTGRSLVLGDDQTVVVPALQDAADDAGLGRERAADDWLQGWARDERLKAALMQQEEHSVGDGDGVLVLGWSTAKRRPRLRVYDPAGFFPDLASRDTVAGADGQLWEDDFPPVVHVAFAREVGAAPDVTRILRRFTWRMVPLPGPTVTAWGGARSWTCLYSVTEWPAEQLRAGDTIYNLTPGRARGVEIVPEVDLQVDFIPVVHVPNDEPGERFFGRALILRVAQILDDLAGSDTDVALTSEVLASPPTMFTGGAAAANRPAGPGASWGFASGEGAQLLDTSHALDAGLKYNNGLRDTLAINARLTLALLGQVSPKDVPSGYALQLGFAPARQLLREMRQVREEKHRLLLKMAQRMAQAYGVLDRGPTVEAVIDLGASLPSDRQAAVDEVAALLPVGGMSTDTAVRILQAAGLPIDDAQAEVERIRHESPAKAVQIVDATGDASAARHFLGLAPGPAQPPAAPPAPPAPPTTPIPAVPPAPGG